MKTLLLTTLATLATGSLLVATPQEANAQNLSSCNYTINTTWHGTCTYTHPGTHTTRYRTSNGHTITVTEEVNYSYSCPVVNGHHYHPAFIDGSPGCKVGKGVGYTRVFKLNGTFSFTIYH